MPYTKETGKELFNKVLYHPYYKHKCEYCDKDIIVSLDECERLNEVGEKIDHLNKKDNGQLPISDGGVLSYKCPNCGHINTFTYFEIKEKRCFLDGEQHNIKITDIK